MTERASQHTGHEHESPPPASVHVSNGEMHTASPMQAQLAKPGQLGSIGVQL